MPEPPSPSAVSLNSKKITDLIIRVGIVAIIITLGVKVFSPFSGLLVWALILAVALYPLHQKLAGVIDNKGGIASTLMVIVALVLLGSPMAYFGFKFAGDIQTLASSLEQGTLDIPEPSDSVAEWPLIGETVDELWNEAADNLPGFIEARKPQVNAFMRKGLALALNAITTTFLFFAALAIAGVFMAYGKSGTTACRQIISRFSNPQKGPALQQLSVATIRSVAIGVIGVATIQAALFGIGFVLAGIPAAGILVAVTLILGIMQVPALLVAIPIILYLWVGGDGSNTFNIVFTIFFIIASLADNILKPMLLGRGVDVPMPVILLGALGGMISSGFIGLFTGAIILSIAYRIFMDWVNDESGPSVSTEEVESAAK